MTPEKEPTLPTTEAISFRIPPELFREFKNDVRIVVKYPWLIGMPVPFALRPDALKNLPGFDVFIVPKTEMW